MFLLPKTSQQENVMLNALKEMVRRSGANFMGLQYDLLDSYAVQLWFTNPNTDSPLNITLNLSNFNLTDLDVTIRAALADNDRDYARRKVSVRVQKLRDISEKLSGLSKEIAALYEEKR